MHCLQNIAAALALCAYTASATEGPSPVFKEPGNPNNIPGQYMVQYDPGFDIAPIVNRIRELTGKEPAFVKSLNVVPMTLSDIEVQMLRNDPNVASITQDQKITIQAAAPFASYRKRRQLELNNKNDLSLETLGLALSDQEIYSGYPWALDRLDQRNLPLDSAPFNVGPWRGQGVDIYVVDSGLDSTHQEFEGRGSCFWSHPGLSPTGSTSDCSDPLSHGTFVASIAAGKTVGVASQATVKGVRVITVDPSTGMYLGSTLTVLHGLDSILNRPDKTRPAVAITSVLDLNRTPFYKYLIDLLWEDRVTFYNAAGNSATDACYFSPSWVGNATSVGATAFRDQYVSFSNHGPCVDIFAPGVFVQGAVAGTTNAIDADIGTSVSAPLVAGTAAVYLSQFPYAGPVEVRNAVLGNAVKDVITNIPTSTVSPNLLVNAVFAKSCRSLRPAIAGDAWCSNLANTAKKCVAKGVCDMMSPYDMRPMACKGKNPAQPWWDKWCQNVSCDPVYKDFCQVVPSA